MIGMRKANAFAVACQRERVGKLSINQHPVLYTNGNRQGYYRVSICDLETEALQADRWVFIEAAWLRERRVTLEFGESGLEAITANLRGMDP